MLHRRASPGVTSDASSCSPPPLCDTLRASPMHLRSIAVLSLLAACSSAARPVVAVAPPSPPRTLRGTVRFEARRPTPAGASREGELRPARFIAINALDASDHTLRECATDA